MKTAPRVGWARASAVAGAFAVMIAVAACGGSGVHRTSAPCLTPYAASSPWNTPIGAGPRIDADGGRLIAGLGSVLTSDPTQYTFPVYPAASGPPADVTVAGVYSDVSGDGSRLAIHHDAQVRIPLGPEVAPASGTDAQIIVLDARTGDEWGLWQAVKGPGGRWQAEDGYHYNTRWSGVPPHDPQGRPFGSRGAGVPYLAGLVRPCEIARGRIDHALALAARDPSSAFVFPATKSDGPATSSAALPEGARLQLDPSLTAAQLRARGCDGPCLTIARAMQVYGMYVVDTSGRTKIVVEDDQTARWNGLVTADTTSSIPVAALRLVAPARR